MENIYRKIAYSMTNVFAEKGIISKENKPIYLYGFEILFSTLAYTIIFVLTALISNTFKSSMTFWAGFFLLRTLAGGYHAQTYITCHMLFFINHVAFIALYYLTPQEWYSQLSLVLIIASAIIVMVLAPVDNPNKPFIKSEKRRFKILSNTYIIVVLLIALTCHYLMPNTFSNYSASYAIGTISAAISLLGAKILRIKEGIQ